MIDEGPPLREHGTDLSHWLKRAREGRGISQVVAAREIGVARTAYRLWEMGAATPAPERCRGLAEWLDVSMVTLLLALGVLSTEDVTGDGPDRTVRLDDGDRGSDTAEGLIARGVERALVTAAEAAQFREIISRLRDGLACGPAMSQGPPSAGLLRGSTQRYPVRGMGSTAG